MRIAYLSTDEVNVQLAEAMASACGLTLYSLAPKDSPPDEEFDAVLYDWDSWPVERRQEMLAQLLAGRRPRVVVVHGYNVADDQTEALRQQGVAVYRRLRPQLFRLVRRALRVPRAAQALSCNPQCA